MSNDTNHFANSSEIQESEAVLLDSPTGREDHLGMAEASSLVAGEIKKPIARPKCLIAEGSRSRRSARHRSAEREAVPRLLLPSG
ncbi:MAG: hypothetical protein JO000_19155 [Alphaproteobacteria bacterium]|nr:hypothetical protein [Alphaproteobacteria bacterium]